MAKAHSLLRARGGISFCRIMPRLWWGSSPRTRRYFLCMRLICLMVCLFSAHAEVFPTVAQNLLNTATLLRARGGISPAIGQDSRLNGSSPRTRRYFRRRRHRLQVPNLFSAHAEVFPSEQPTAPAYRTLLRARGGISLVSVLLLCHGDSSPRTRRYFPVPHPADAVNNLFSAHAEVFP